MTAPTLATTPADITLPDLERAARSPLTWQIFPWGLSGASGQRWVRDQLVIVNPALPAEQRRRQLAVVRSWIPAGEATVLLVTLAVPLWLAIALHTFWPLLGWIVPALLVMRPSDVDSATHDQLLDQVMQRLLDHPHESWCNPDLDALAQAPAA